MVRRIYLDDIVRTLIAYLESKGTQRGYPQCRYSIRKTCRSSRLRQTPTNGAPAYNTVWNRLDKALRGASLPGLGRAPPAVSLDPLLDNLIIESVEGLIEQFPPRPSELRKMKEVRPEDRRYVYLSNCVGGVGPRGLVNVVRVIRGGGRQYDGRAQGVRHPGTEV